MTKKVFTLHEDDEVIKAVRLMREADISAIPIVRDNNALVGIVSRADMLEELIGFLKQ
jgi:CBS domain-containing protein